MPGQAVDACHKLGRYFTTTAACINWYRKSEAPSLASSLRMGSAAGDAKLPAKTTPCRPGWFLCMCGNSAAAGVARRLSNLPPAGVASVSSWRRWFVASGFGLNRGNGGAKAGCLCTSDPRDPSPPTGQVSSTWYRCSPSPSCSCLHNSTICGPREQQYSSLHGLSPTSQILGFSTFL